MSEIYNTSENSKFFGYLLIENIDLKTPVLNEYSTDNLKISICKFYGNGLNENGNVTIIGHNYNDERFFGNLYKLKENDEIKIIKEDNQYVYKIVKKYEINSDDLSCLDPLFLNTKEITLVTCKNNNKKKRLVIKALLIK